MQAVGAFNPVVHPAGESVQAGPWLLTLEGSELGNQALATMTTANAANGDGPLDLQWAIAWVSATNTSDQIQVINVSDFSACGAEGIIYQSPITMGPYPTLQGAVAPGETREGGVPFWVGDLSNVLMRFSSQFLGGDWADAWFALSPNATMPDYGTIPSASPLGTTPATPAAFGQTVRAGDFDVTLLKHITGQEAYDIAPSGTQAWAWGPWDTENWHSIYLTARNVSNRPRFFSFVALRFADTTGEPWDHLLQLSAAAPDAARELLPGATIEGWVSIETKPWVTLDLVRIRPSSLDDSARYVGFGAAGEPMPDAVTDLQPGDIVTITTSTLNLREAPSLSGEVVTMLEDAETLEITGDPIEVDGFLWYPITVSDSGATGYVASNYLERVTEP